jgi:hypothetical protein
MLLTDAQILRVLGAELESEHGKIAFVEGQHALGAQLSLRILGTVEQGADQLIAPTAQIPLHAVLALACDDGGIGWPRMKRLILEAMSEPLKGGKKVGDCVGSKAAEAATKDIIDALPRVSRRGALRRLVRMSHLRLRPLVQSS